MPGPQILIGINRMNLAIGIHGAGNELAIRREIRQQSKRVAVDCLRFILTILHLAMHGIAGDKLLEIHLHRRLACGFCRCGGRWFRDGFGCRSMLRGIECQFQPLRIQLDLRMIDEDIARDVRLLDRATAIGKRFKSKHATINPRCIHARPTRLRRKHRRTLAAENRQRRMRLCEIFQSGGADDRLAVCIGTGHLHKFAGNRRATQAAVAGAIDELGGMDFRALLARNHRFTFERNDGITRCCGGLCVRLHMQRAGPVNVDRGFIGRSAGRSRRDGRRACRRQRRRNQDR